MIHSGREVAGWRYGYASDGAVHVEPMGDLIAHEVQDCPCGPSTEPVKRSDGGIGWMVSHHSLDGRESYERGEDGVVRGGGSVG